MNPCLQRRVRFAHPPLQHRFRACRGLRPWTPGCIPIIVLAVLDPNHLSWLLFWSVHLFCLSTHSHLSICSIHPFTSVHLFHLSTCSHLWIYSICPPIHICPPVPSVHPFTSVHLFYPPVHICPSVLSVHLFCLSTCSHLSTHSHLSHLFSHSHLSTCSCLSTHSICPSVPSVHPFTFGVIQVWM